MITYSKLVLGEQPISTSVLQDFGVVWIGLLGCKDVDPPMLLKGSGALYKVDWSTMMRVP